VKKLNFDTYGPDPSIVAVDRTSLFLTGTFENAKGAPASLIRIERRGLTVAARAVLPTVTSVAYGDGALWWATGALLGNAGQTMIAGHGRLLVKVNPVSLAVRARFTLPAPTMLVAVARGDLWVATPANLVRVNPTSGAVVATVALGFSPVALAASYDAKRLYALGSTSSNQLVLADYSAASGRQLGLEHVARFSGGPLAVAQGGVWTAVGKTGTQSTNDKFFQGPGLSPGPSVGGFTFDTEPYVADNILWLVDAGGNGPTVCADPASGRTRVKGGPVGIEYGAVASYGSSTYLLHDVGASGSLLQIAPTASCSGS
jgi:hypothetical protein